MKIIQTRFLILEQKRVLFELWNSEYPVKIGYKEISEFENYLNSLYNTQHYLLIDGQNQILGWAFTFLREEEDWFGIIINSKIHGKGFGTLLLNELKKNKSVLNGWASDGQNDLKPNNEYYLSPINFYSKSGFLICKNFRIENEKISAVKIRWSSEEA